MAYCCTPDVQGGAELKIEGRMAPEINSPGLPDKKIFRGDKLTSFYLWRSIYSRNLLKVDPQGKNKKWEAGKVL